MIPLERLSMMHAWLVAEIKMEARHGEEEKDESQNGSESAGDEAKRWRY
jgi:hypothetical protein